MSKQLSNPKSEKGGKEKMVTASFRVPETWLTRLVDKLGPLAVPSRIYRILLGMYLDGKIEITNEDAEKYS